MAINPLSLTIGETASVTRRLVIDTDIGTDVDDLWTLAMVPNLVDVNLEAVTIVYGDTDLRARLASVALQGMGLDVPVYCGCEQPMSGKSVLWAGHEGVDVPGISDATYSSRDGVEVLVELAASDPGTLEILAIGPLTNIAEAIRRDPDFARNLKRLIVMGGEFKSGWPEHNFVSDAVATDIVLRSGAPITIVPLDQTLRVFLHEADIDRVSAEHPIGRLIAEQSRTFWQWLSTLREGMPNDRSPAHDPLALLVAIEPEHFTLTPMTVKVDDEGRVSGTPDERSPAQVVTDLDAEGAHRALTRFLEG